MEFDNRNDSVKSSPVFEDRSLPFCFLDSLPEPVVVLDDVGTVKVLNQSFRRYVDRIEASLPEEPADVHYFDLLEGILNESRTGIKRGLDELFEGERDQIEVEYETNIQGRDCRYRLTAEIFECNQERYVTVTHSRLEDPVNQTSGDPGPGPRNFTNGGLSHGSDRARLLRELNETTRDLMSAEAPEDVARTATEIADDYFQYATVGFRILRDEQLHFLATKKNDPRIKDRTPPAYDIGETFVGETFQEGEARIVPDLEAASEDAPFDYSPMKSAMLLPVGRYGLISIASSEPDAFDELDLELGRQFAADVESAMERARREEKLRDRELELRRTTVDQNYLRSILDTLPAGLVIATPEGEIKTTNETLEKMLGFDDGQLVGEDVFVIFAGGKEVTRQRFETIRSMDGPMYEETEFQADDGETIPVFLTGEELEKTGSEANEMIMVGIDISELKLKNKQLRDSERRLSLALNAAGAGVWEWNLQTGEEYWDQNTERLFGLDPGEFGGNYADFVHFVHEEDLEELEAATQNAIEKRGNFEKEFRIESAEGKERWLLSRGEVYTDVEGEPRTMIGVTVDITERREVQNALEQALNEKETLLREIHHRVKNNMQIIQSLLSMQHRNWNSTDLDKAFQESISRVQTMAMVHENLYQSEDLADVNFRDYLRTLCENLLGTHGARDTVTLDLTVTNESLGLDKSIACGLIVNELVTNSLEHGLDLEDGGFIEIRFETTGDDRLQLTVRDNGRGCEEPFDGGDSTGTGLAIVRSLAEYELGGNIEYDGSDGFTVVLTFER